MLTRILFLTVGLLSFAAQAQAQIIPIPEGTDGLSPITGTVTNVEQRRIPVGDAVTGSETVVTMQFKLAGCLDKLMPLVTHTETKGNRVIFYVTALNAHNQASKVSLCAAMPQASAQVRVPGLFQRNQIRVVFMGQR